MYYILDLTEVSKTQREMHHFNIISVIGIFGKDNVVFELNETSLDNI